MPFDLESWRRSKQTSGFDIESWRTSKKMEPFGIDIGPKTAEPSTTGMPWEYTYGLPEAPTPQLGGGVGFLQRLIQGAERFPTEMAAMPGQLATRFKELSREGPYAGQKLVGEMATGMAEDIYQRFWPTKLLSAAGRTWQDPFGTLMYATPGMLKAGAAYGIYGLKGLGKAARAAAKGAPTTSFRLWKAGTDLQSTLRNIFKTTKQAYEEGIKGRPAEQVKRAGDIWEGDIAEGLWALDRFKRTFNDIIRHEGHREIAYRWLDDSHQAKAQGRPNVWQKDFDMLPPEAQQATSAARDIFETIFELESEAGLNIPYRSFYAPGFFKPTKVGAKGIRRFWRKTTPHAKHKQFENVQEALEAGFEPRTTDLLDVIDWRAKNAIKIVSNKRLLTGLRELIDPETNNPLIVNASEAIAKKLGWPELDIKPLRRHAPWLYESIHVHPDIYKPLKVMFGEPASGWLRGALTVNAFMKKTLLSMSLFHWHALTESGIASLGAGKGMAQAGAGLAEAGRIFFGKQGRTLPKGLAMYYEGDPMLRMGIRHGLVLGPTEDVGRSYSIINRAMDVVEKRVPIAAGPAWLMRKTLGGLEQRWDRALWDTYHRNFKAYAFTEHYHYLLRKKPNIPTEKLAEEAARLTNFAFGGLNWRKLGVTPGFRNFLQVTFLAPDWTLSNLGVAHGALRGGPAAMSYAKYWLRAGIYYTAFSQLTNYAFTKLKSGEGHFTWDNTPGHKFDIELPYRAPDAKGNIGNRYLRIGKQFREPFQLLWDTVEIAKGEKIIPDIIKSKLGIIPRAGIEQLTGRTLHGYPWLQGSIYQPRQMGAYEELGRRTLYQAEQQLPIPVGYGVDILRGKDIPSAAISAGGFPVSKASAYRMKRLLAEARIAGDSQRERELWNVARQNNLGITESDIKTWVTILQK